MYFQEVTKPKLDRMGETLSILTSWRQATYMQNCSDQIRDCDWRRVAAPRSSEGRADGR